MSSYENYHKTSRVYDKTRSAGGVETILQALVAGPLPLQQQVLVDAGCGTGLYTAALIGEVQRIEAVDLNAGMLEMAQSKLTKEFEEGRIRFHQSAIGTLPLPDDSMDAVMTNQVLHHLPDDAAANWPGHTEVFREFARVLKPGGCVIINSCGHEQLEQGFWFYRLIPDALQAVKEKAVDLGTLDTLLQESGFDALHREVPLDLVLQGDAYLLADGILDPDWRRGDSIWSLVAADALADVLAKVTALRDAGKLEAFMQHHDQPRTTTGQVTFTIARKPS